MNSVKKRLYQILKFYFSKILVGLNIIKIELKILLISVLMVVIFFEIILRLVDGISLVNFSNFISESHNFFKNNSAVQYDKNIGWVNRRFFQNEGDNFYTGRFGNRVVSSNEDISPDNAILVIGDSFSVGSGVKGDQTFSAYLEKYLNVPILNLGSGGYGPDQSALLAEEFIDNYKPRAIILSHTSETIAYFNLKMYSGAYKPYFVNINGNLQLYNQPVPIYGNSILDVGFFQSVLGYSYAFFRTARRLQKDDLLGNNLVNRLVDGRSPTEFGDIRNLSFSILGCKVLERLAKKASKKEIKLIWFVLHSGPTIRDSLKQFDEISRVNSCAEDYNYLVVDTFSNMKNIFNVNIDDFNKLYLFQPPEYGHMSSEGNLFLAKLLRDKIQSNWSKF